MSFCHECGNLLLPKKNNGKKELYCKACDETYPIKTDVDYKIETQNINGFRSSTSRIIVNAGKKHITEDDRETYEEFFTAGAEWVRLLGSSNHINREG